MCVCLRGERAKYLGGVVVYLWERFEWGVRGLFGSDIDTV